MLWMLTLQFLSGFALLSLIWIVQILIYPRFHFVPEAQFKGEMKFHTQRISWIVIPLMLLEAGSAAYLFLETPDFVQRWELMALVLFIFLIWMSTFLIQVPLHQSLARRRSDKKIRQLVWSNGIRTLLWTLKAILLAQILARLLADINVNVYAGLFG